MSGSTSFSIGLLIRLILIVGVIPWTQEEWFVPFLTFLPRTESADVWASFVASGGDSDAFPYGIVYIATFAPLTLLGDSIGGAYGAMLGLGATILALDFAMLKTLQHLSEKKYSKSIVWLYWLSPVTLYIGYWHGHLDILPTLLLAVSFVCLKKANLARSAVFLALSVAAKLSMLLAVPLFAVHIFGSPQVRSQFTKFIAICLGTMFATFLCVFWAQGYREMALGSDEFQKAIALALRYDDTLALYILPMVSGGLFLVMWRLRRTSLDGLISLSALGFLGLYLLTPAAPGWAIWSVGFFALMISKSSLRGILLFLAFGVLFVLLHLLISPGAKPAFNAAAFFDPQSLLDIPLQVGELQNWLFSLLAVCGMAISVQVFRDQILNDNFHLWTRKPIVIGISGDSGAGKDTLSELIRKMFEMDASSTLSGDDYHMWDRHKPMWRSLTHLHPRANDLDRFAADALTLSEGRAVRARHYDHSLGRMTKPSKIRPKEIIVVSGLHALYNPQLNERYDLKIFLDMDEELRRYLKIKRDVSVRGHSLEKVIASIQSRKNDSAQFIKPQMRNADIIVSLEPTDANDLRNFEYDIDQLKLRIRIVSKHEDSLRELEHLLVSVCGLHAVQSERTDGLSELMVEGAPASKQIRVVGEKLATGMKPHLSLLPEWCDSQNGILQLIVLGQLDRLRIAAGGRD